jgi:outer membrane protein TolC
MLRKLIRTSLITFFLLFDSHNASLSQSRDDIKQINEKKEQENLISYSEINTIILKNNQELKSLNELVLSSKFNLNSELAKRNPSLDLTVNGLPQYQKGRTYNSNSGNTKTSQLSVNPSLQLKLDIFDPLRGNEIKIAKLNYEIAQNNYEIRKKDLIQEAKSRYHELQKSYQDVLNKEIALDLSIQSLKDAESKLETGIGTKFEVLEANAQLTRDRQLLNEKKIQQKINELALREILNIKKDFNIEKKQALKGYWNYDLETNLKSGIQNNLSLKNTTLQKKIKQNQAENFLNANKPKIFISNTFSSSFTKGDSLTSTAIDSDEYGSSYTNTISLNFSWNIFDGGQNRNSFKSQMASANEENFSYFNIQNILESDINKAHLNLKLNEAKILSTLDEVSSTKESLRLSRLRYEVGISTLKDVLLRQKELSDARSKNIDAIYNYNLNLDQLERLTFLKINNDCTDRSIDKIKNQPSSICDI